MICGCKRGRQTISAEKEKLHAAGERDEKVRKKWADRGAVKEIKTRPKSSSGREKKKNPRAENGDKP